MYLFPLLCRDTVNPAANTSSLFEYWVTFNLWLLPGGTSGKVKVELNNKHNNVTHFQSINLSRRAREFGLNYNIVIGCSKVDKFSIYEYMFANKKSVSKSELWSWLRQQTFLISH